MIVGATCRQQIVLLGHLCVSHSHLRRMVSVVRLDTSEAGLLGCCGTAGFSIGINCPGLEDVVRVFLRIDEPTAQPGNCNKYNINYHF